MRSASSVTFFSCSSIRRSSSISRWRRASGSSEVRTSTAGCGAAADVGDDFGLDLGLVGERFLSPRAAIVRMVRRGFQRADANLALLGGQLAGCSAGADRSGLGLARLLVDRLGLAAPSARSAAAARRCVLTSTVTALERPCEKLWRTWDVASGARFSSSFGRPDRLKTFFGSCSLFSLMPSNTYFQVQAKAVCFAAR
jgi:hypothetical protein